MPSYINKLKIFNQGVNVWAVPHRGTEEAKMVERGQRFHYTLLKERYPDLHKQITNHKSEPKGFVKKQIKDIEMKIKKPKGK